MNGVAFLKENSVLWGEGGRRRQEWRDRKLLGDEYGSPGKNSQRSGLEWCPWRWRAVVILTLVSGCIALLPTPTNIVI